MHVMTTKQAEWYQRQKTSPEFRAKRAAYMREWHRRNPRRVKHYAIKKKYGIGMDEFDALVAEQEDACAVCRDRFDHVRYRGIAIDHCHTTGRVRGLLCPECNTMLARARDRIDVLENAIAYLGRIA